MYARNAKGVILFDKNCQYKGIDQDIVKSIMEAIDPEDEYAGALKIARTKWKQTSGETDG